MHRWYWVLPNIYNYLHYFNSNKVQVILIAPGHQIVKWLCR